MKKKKEITFDVYDPGELAAGNIGFSDTVTITVESGDPGGDAGDFEREMLQALKDWYDGPSVTLRTKPLKLYNGRFTNRQTIYIAAYNDADAARILQQAYRKSREAGTTFDQAGMVREIKAYFNKGAWGQSMAGILPERGAWVTEEHGRDREASDRRGREDHTTAELTGIHHEAPWGHSDQGLFLSRGERQAYRSVCQIAQVEDTHEVTFFLLGRYLAGCTKRHFPLLGDTTRTTRKDISNLLPELPTSLVVSQFENIPG